MTWAKGIEVSPVVQKKEQKKVLVDSEDLGLCLNEDTWIQWETVKLGNLEFKNPRPIKNHTAEWLYCHWSMDFNDHSYAAKPDTTILSQIFSSKLIDDTTSVNFVICYIPYTTFQFRLNKRFHFHAFIFYLFM